MNNSSLRKQAGQLPLHLPLEAATAREDLVVGESNRHAVEFIDSWPDGWPIKVSILSGDKGSGKSHLSQVWAAQSQARFLQPNLTLPESIPPNTNFVVENLRQGSFSEVWLFHLLNTAKSTGSYILLTSRSPYQEWGIVLPDLLSRLRSAHKLEVTPPDDILLAAVLVKLFSDRQLSVDKSVIDYLLNNMDRSLAFASKFVSRLDEVSLTDKRSVTRPLASKVLSEMSQ